MSSPSEAAPEAIAIGNWPGEPVYADSRLYRTSRVYECAKRSIDIVIVLLLTPICLPVILILATLVRRDGGKALFPQVRVGRGGATFTLWKLRTMAPDAEAVLADYLAQNPEMAREWRETQKLRRDPRVTRLGEFIRKHSLDELPQLWNVLIGDMSLVGPRPMLPEQKELYPGTAYYLMRPGLTGLWQISTRNGGSFASRATYDERYAEIRSVPVDIFVVLMTVGVVIRGTGF